MAFDTLPRNATLKPKPFRAEASQKSLDDLSQLIKLSPLGPHTYENSGKDKENWGITYEWLSQAKSRWETDYDWRKAEARINSFPNFTVDIKNEGGDGDGETVSVHFLALFSEQADAIPIVFLHGWPGSFLEFLDILALIKSKFSSASDLPYHIVVPSLPGYGYSGGAPLSSNWATEDIARVVNHLMVGLGFGDGYVAQGGDVGSFVSRMLAVDYESCKAVHLNMCMIGKPEGFNTNDLDDFDRRGLAKMEYFTTRGNGYNREHATRPATIGHVLSSSPLALLAWIGEKFLEWTDEDPPLDEILNSITLYWLTSSFARSIYPYRQLAFKPISSASRWKIPPEKPFGFSSFGHEIGSVPRSWVATTGNLTWFTRHERGGHFAAMEKPDLLWADVEDFVGKNWKGQGGNGGAGGSRL